MANSGQSPEGYSKEEMTKFETENNMPVYLQAAGQTEKAVAYYKRTIERRTQDYGETSFEVGMALHDLGELYLDVGRLRKAEDVLWSALEIRAALATLPRDDEDDVAFEVRRRAAISRDVLGRVYERRGDIDGARRIRTAGLELGQASCGNCQVTTRPQLCNLRLHTHEVVRACC